VFGLYPEGVASQSTGSAQRHPVKPTTKHQTPNTKHQTPNTKHVG
jgi:hypothetical protein